MTRAHALAHAADYFDSGAFKADLARRVAIPSESQNPDRADELVRYLRTEMIPTLEALGFQCRTIEHDRAPGPFLYAERIEDPDHSTVLGYAHGDVIRGLDAGWRKDAGPWRLVEMEGRYWGRGVSDNKGQHTINIGALAAVLKARGALGFNAKWLIEMGEETGSRGLREVCRDNRALLTADVFLASDGPRLSAERPTIFLGSRGSASIDLWIDAREGGHHSGNWGGLLSSPAIQLAHALSTITDPQGRILIPELRPDRIPDSVRRALSDCAIEREPGDPTIDPNWGEPGLTPAEKVFAWCAFEILAMTAGNPESPVNAVPPRAWARTQVRFVVGVDPNKFIPALRRHLDRHGFAMVQVAPASDEIMQATRVDPQHPWVCWAADSLARTT
jgi:acetylornithine deacetylase/succinyl-diaminopimelate desuccinylase-like protein